MLKTKILIWQLVLITFLLASCSVKEEKAITILETTDLHGVILPYDFIEKKEIKASLAGVSTYVNQVRKGERPVILLDNGDNLQGQPAVYYYNFIDTVSPHIMAGALNFIGYDAGTVGNHDIEAGHAVYDRLVRKYKFPLLAANAINKTTGKPYFKPYTIIEKNGISVAVIGMITPSVPDWLPPELYSGIEFRDMLETAKTYMPEVLKEKPDVVIGLFHSGWDERGDQTVEGSHNDENGVSAIAWNVPGFDIIMCGHNHNVVNKNFVNSKGDTVLVLEGGSRSEKIGRADVVFHKDRKSGKMKKTVTGKIINVNDYEPDKAFLAEFSAEKDVILEYVSKVIAKSEASISSRDSYFGSSPFVDMVHSVQLDITKADISFSAPLSFDVRISAGPVTVSDMFKLYRFENMLYTMSMSGSEIKKYLEFSYSGWLNTMKGPGDHLLKFQVSKDGKPVMKNGQAWLRNQPYNFDSAAGLEYTIDVSKPEGKRVTIKSFTNGNTFDPEKTYLVAVNSYRGNGGGGHFSAAGISAKDIPDRLVRSTEKDLRYYILKNLEAKGTIKPLALNNWKIIPEEWVKKARVRDYELLFGK
ncbi:MAG TPA: bifunctional metallophosphatase/5'-nucleotidase [Bacteroidales bacterium]|nr:bifunctional metallophosphatase/5'-nucleotidase [Bacteroidales bacterium]